MSHNISIIIPVYNSELYLEECLRSIINQTYSHLEIILINDGSTDNSKKICEDFLKKDDRIVLVNTINQGQAAARNIGLDIASGDYISFIDSDDTISENLFKDNIDILKLDKTIEVLQFPIFMNYGLKNESLIIKQEGYIETQELLFENWLVKNRISWLVCNKIFKSIIFNDLRFKEGMIYEDNLMVVDVLSKINNLYISKKGIYFYHSRVNSTTTSTHNIYKDLDTQKVSLHILDKLKGVNNTNARIQILSRIYNVYQSLYFNYGYKKELNVLFIEEFKSINLFNILKSNIAILQKIKLIIIKLFGTNLLLSKK